MKAEVLWQDYCFLTSELEKFVKQENLVMVESLLGQRAKLQQKIDALPIHEKMVDKEQLRKIENMNRSMLNFLQQAHFKMQRQRQVSSAYERNVAAYHGHIR